MQPPNKPPLPGMRYKSSNELRAQIASFAQHNENPSDRNALLEYAGHVPTQELYSSPDQVTRMVKPGEYLRSEGGYLSEGTRVIADKASYLKVLRGQTDQQREERIGRIPLLGNYEYFRDHPQGVLIGSGDEATAHRFELNNRPYVSIRPSPNSPNPRNSMDNRVIASIRNGGRSNPLVAVSHEGSGEIIAEMRPGKGIGDLSIDELKHVRYNQLQILAETIVEEGKDGVLIDALQKPDNILYDETYGFSLIDLGVVTPDLTNYPLSTELTLTRIAHHLGFGKINQIIPRNHTDYAVLADELEARLFVLKGFQAALASLPIHNAAMPLGQFAKKGEGIGQVAAAMCDTIIRDVEKKRSQYRDANFANEDLARNYRTGRIE